MKLEYHYHHTFALVAESLVRNGEDRDAAFVFAHDVAIADQTIDELTPTNIKLSTLTDQLVYCGLPVITQIDTRSAMRLMVGDSWWPIMQQVHFWHFLPWTANATGTTWKVHLLNVRHSQASAFAMGIWLHNYQDTQGPHYGYVGYPSRGNHLLALRKGRNWPIYRRMWMHIWGIDPGECWGHMLDPNADTINRCRKSAIEISKHIARSICEKPDGTPFLLESIEHLYRAGDDKHLAQLSNDLIIALFDRDIPPYELPTNHNMQVLRATLIDALRRAF